MRVIILTKPLTISDIKIGKLIKNHEKENRVHRLDTPEKFYLFLNSIVDDGTYLDENFENYLVKSHKNMTINDLYYHFINADSFIPKFYTATFKNNRYSNIEKLNAKTIAELIEDNYR